MMLTKQEKTRETLTLEIAGMFRGKSNISEVLIKSLHKKTVFIKNPHKNIMVLEGTNIVYVLSVNDNTFTWYRTGNYVFADVITVRNPKTKEITKISVNI